MMVLRPQWEWRLDSASVEPASDSTSPVFTTRYDAEQWIGEHWRSLAGQGVVAATLLHHGEPVAAALPLPRS